MYTCYGHFVIPQDLTLVEEFVIAYIYLIITIIKHESSGANISITYLWVYRHTIVFP